MAHVVIVGGGVAGLATAACLGERGVPYTVLERGDTPFAGLRQLDPEMQLLTPPAFSRLPGMPARLGDYERFGDVVRQFEAWRAARGLGVVTGVRVERIARDDAGFVVTCSGGKTIAATHVVNATGIIAHPQLPADMSYTGAWQHSLTVRTADLTDARRLVVVGAGMSAAEVIERWLDVRPPGAHAWLSTRKRVIASPQKILGLDIHWWLWAPELFPGRFFGRRIGPERDLIIGRSIVRALRDRTITQVSHVARYERDAVVFADDTRVEPDLVVFATGYRYATEHLGDLVALDDHGHPIVDRHSASTRAPNLYVLGLRFGRSVASSAIRGISRDAAHVAARIARQA
jgi:putative flavoprotein involved in K+ transport